MACPRSAQIEPAQIEPDCASLNQALASCRCEQLSVRCAVCPLCPLPPLPPAHLIPSCHSESASAVRNLLLSLQPSLRGVPVSRQFCETWHSRPDLNGFVSGYAFRRTAPRTPLPARAHQAQLLHAAPVPLTPV